MGFTWAAALVLLFPGLALISWLPGKTAAERSARRDPFCLVADAAALSIAVDALLAMFLQLFGVRLGGAALAALFGVSILAFVVGLRHVVRAALTPARVAGAVFVVGILAALILWRLWQARALALPAWVDSVHHVFIVRKILALGGLPVNLLPEIPAPFSYHYGFHLIAALFTALTGAGAPEAVLWFGQVLNALVALSVYRVALAVQPERLESRLPRWVMPLVAALLTGFVFQMPAYYVTWGRYTMLTGLLLLGPALAAAWEIGQGGRAATGVRLALLLAGLCVTHYFILLVAALFLGVFLLFGLVRAANRAFQVRIILWSVIGLALALPWLARVAAANFDGITVQVISPIGQEDAARQSSLDYLRYILYLIGPRHNHILLAMAGVGVLFALRKPALRPLAVWALLLGLMAAPWGFRLLVFRPDHFAIILFFPASILLADLLVSGAEALGTVTRIGWAAGVSMALAIALLLVWGLRETADVINPQTIIATHADVRALQWIDANTPPEARFLTNATPWQYGVYRGVDGGYWLLPYTGRFGLALPALYETAGKEYFNRVNTALEKVAALTGCTGEFWQFAQENTLTHIYLREGVGNLQPSMLENCQGLRVVFADSGVVVYEITSH